MSRFFLVLSCLVVISCVPKTNLSLMRKAATERSSIIGGTIVPQDNVLTSGIVGIFDMDAQAICTGSIISNEYILTAAHCAVTAPKNLRIYFGSNIDEMIGAREQDIVETYTRQVIGIRVHSEYVVEETATRKVNPIQNYDIALLKFRGGLPPGFKPAQLLVDDAFLKRGTSILIAGFGVNKVDSVEVDPKSIRNIDKMIESGRLVCDDAQTHCFRMDMKGDGFLRATRANIASIQESEFRLDESKGKGSCSGDSGGPAYVEIDGKPYLLGVTSRGDVFCGTEGVYTNAVYYTPWIIEMMDSFERSGK